MSNLALIRQVLEIPTEEAIRALFADRETIFWVDARYEEVEIIQNCQRFLQNGRVTLEYADVVNEADYEAYSDAPYETYICYGDKRLLVQIDPIDYYDSHHMLCMLNEALRPDYEIRFCIDSVRSDIQSQLPKTSWNSAAELPRDDEVIETLGFLVLPTNAWKLLEREFGEDVQNRFHKLNFENDLFEEVLKRRTVTTTVSTTQSQNNRTKRKAHRPWNSA